MRILVVIGILILVSLTSCNKSLKEPRKIKGRMMHDCGVPAPNMEFCLTDLASYPNLGKKRFKEYFETDSLGYFDVEFISNTANEMTIHSKSGTVYLNYIPFPKIGEVLDLGNVYMAFTFNTIVKLEVTNPYTENDTLFYGDMLTEKWIQGPFQSMIIDTIQHYKYGNLLYDYHYNGYSAQAAFSVRSNGQILLRGSENENGILNVPKISDICEDGTMGEAIYHIR